MYTTDLLVVGGGVIGLSVARELHRRYPDQKITLLEKEPRSAYHASGRNSGVLHAGFYYTADSMKALYTRDGNKALTEYCLDRKIPINQCGKLVVAKNQEELAGLDELIRRGKANNIELQEVTEQEAKEIEPRVKTYERALYSPTTSVVDPSEVMSYMKKDAEDEGVEIHYNVEYENYIDGGVWTNNGVYLADYVVNAAGLYADKVALDFGFSEKTRILPFKGLYLYSNEQPGAIKTNIYPVPDLRNPFLGVHYTVTVDGHIKIGPTAIPAFWREQYGLFERFNFKEMRDILVRQVGLAFNSGFDFSQLAIEELKKYNKSHLVNLATSLATNVHQSDYKTWGKPGIRAQLLNIETKELIMDFMMEGDKRSFHVLNAVSPAFTCSIPFAERVCDEIDAILK